MKFRFIVKGLLLILLMSSGCGRRKGENMELSVKDSVQNQSLDTSTEKAPKKSNYELLQGKWQSEDDPKSYIVFDKNILKDIYEGISKGDGEEYALSDYCLNDLDKDPDGVKETERYISLLKSDMCWHINHLDSMSLSLVYMGRGNFLGYKKVK
jgi:hypothetical protein